MGDQIVRELREKVEDGRLPMPEDLAKFNAMLRHYGLKPIVKKGH